MSRLDDELKIAFKREEPSPDFAARVLERINSTPAPQQILPQRISPRQSFWRRLADLFPVAEPRRVAIGVAAALLVAIGAAQYMRLHRAPVEEGSKVEAVNTTPNQVNAPPDQTSVTASNSQNVFKKVLPIKRRSANRLVQSEGRATTIAIRKQQRPSPEAEAAKERVLFALQIAGATLNDAQKAIQDSGPNDKPEPLNNR
jgi:hypothetical protein